MNNQKQKRRVRKELIVLGTSEKLSWFLVILAAMAIINITWKIDSE